MSYVFIIWLALVAFLILISASLPLKEQPRKQSSQTGGNLI